MPTKEAQAPRYHWKAVQVAADGYLLVQGDSNRDGVADFAFLVYATSLGAGDFVL